MLLPLGAIIAGLVLLVWSAERFIDGASSTAHHFKMPPLLIGMIIVGFGTSAPELVVSVLAALQNNPGIALGNAYGSNITNIALILGLTAVISPIAVHSRVLRMELPILTAITALAGWQLLDGTVSRGDAVVLLGVFGVLMAWTIWQGMRTKTDALGAEIDQEMAASSMPLHKAVGWLAFGLALLVASSRILVWGLLKSLRGWGSAISS